MRNIVNINQGWHFLKDCAIVPEGIPEESELINLPHSWNAVDGMDGGADFEKVRAWDAKNPDKAIGQYEYSIYNDGDPKKLHEAQKEIAKQYEVADEAADTEEGR